MSALQQMFLGTSAAGGWGLWAWGKNYHGQLGLGNLTNYSSPKQVGALTTWSVTSGGDFFTAGIYT